MKLKQPSTVIVEYKPTDCPACGCVRFEQKKRFVADRLLNRAARFSCAKCGRATVQISRMSDHRQAPSIADREDDLLQAKKFCILAKKYTSGDEAQNNFKLAFHLYRQAALLGFPPAQLNLSVFYQKGLGTAKDLGQSKHWCEVAAQSGLKRAIKRMQNLKYLNSDLH